MKRFILLTFGFLGWAFYEMSGGSEFQPKSVQMAALAPVVETELPNTNDAAASQTPQVQTKVVDNSDTTTADVTRVSLNLNESSDVTQAVELALASQESEDTSVVEISTQEIPVNVISTEDTPAIIPSLIIQNDAGVAIQETSSDIRSVSGNRVNVRGGPGTDFDIVLRLNRGAAVEIISDNGNGWVKMRPVDGGPEGWMADFLLTNG